MEFLLSETYDGGMQNSGSGAVANYWKYYALLGILNTGIVAVDVNSICVQLLQCKKPFRNLLKFLWSHHKVFSKNSSVVSTFMKVTLMIDKEENLWRCILKFSGLGCKISKVGSFCKNCKNINMYKYSAR